MSLVGLDSKEAISNYKHDGTSEDLPREFRRRVVEDLVAAASSAYFSASVGAGPSIIDVPYVAFGDLVDSSLSTLTVTSLGHVTEVLSPAFDVGTLFYEVNVTSLTYTVDASARSDAATGLKVKRHTPSTLCTRQLPRSRKLKVLVLAHDVTTTTYIVHAFFQP